MHKKIGFFESERVGLFHIPDFLKSKYKLVLYSYDPNKDFYDQPFYKIDCRNVLRVPGSVDIQCSVPCTPSVNDQGKVIDTFGPYKIPAGKYWVMGDNRKNSVDSRVWHFVDRKFIRGKVRFIIWSVDTEEEYWMFECVKHPLRFFNKLVRWNRFFKKIK